MKIDLTHNVDISRSIGIGSDKRKTGYRIFFFTLCLCQNVLSHTETQVL